MLKCVECLRKKLKLCYNALKEKKKLNWPLDC